MPDIDTDFCIVGSGPAGMTLALLLLRSGARVAVVERSPSLRREYRGEVIQPGGLAVLDQLGVLSGARERGAWEHSRFQLVEGDRPLLDVDYRALPAPYNCLLSLPQQHLLAEMLEACRRYEGFTDLSGHRVEGLLRSAAGVRGAEVGGAGGRGEIRAHCVIGADGRHSKVRRLAGIRNRRFDLFDLDVLWFKIPSGPEPPSSVRIYRGRGNPVLAYGSYPDGVQLGWTLPHRGYRAAAEQGIDHVKRQIRTTVPGYADAIDAHLASLSDLTLLDVFAAGAERWSVPGLVLLGDSAHTLSPLGSQGINLALQDAALLHPVLMRALRAPDQAVSLLREYERARRRDIVAVMRIQRIQSRSMLSVGGIGARVFPRIARILGRTPLQHRMTRRIAFGNRPVRVASELFVADQRK
ncbi:FAD-dependent monooxygenase [Streptomyces iconiensis]|uniref:FAD-dependent monooxygenase n=1 Tax=Streptomyces iconiensis TaxID=1384038 RepID=A0ABT7A6D7_9ACTN|nr:FAD-dependent monooxygenase [Streptomyces iconiensis]MDJ1136890.1 FAD-dependent monooxygenase [Streptomyces iconiensis]